MLRTRGLPRARLVFAAAVAVAASGSGAAVAADADNVVLITLDGLRTQEMFGGLDLGILRAEAGDDPVESHPAYERYWAPSAAERRQKLMPFFWGVLMRDHGSIAGDRDRGSVVTLENRHWFSYPGYSEMLTGEPHDAVIDSNDAVQNPYPSVLEFVKEELDLAPEQVAVFASWDRFNWIAESRPGTIAINAGAEPYAHPDPAVQALSRIQSEVPEVMADSRFDAFTFRLALAHLKTHRPRVLYIAFGETDEWAHEGEYERTLDAAARTDGYLRELWEFLESDEQYRGRTALILTTDHGRGVTGDEWRHHGSRIAEAEYVWMAFVSPGSPLRGEWTDAELLHSSQVAATLARLLGLDYRRDHPDAAPPVAALFH